ncbi:MAG: hypothetical protein QXJ74_05655 [Nitrososphaera sp.]
MPTDRPEMLNRALQHYTDKLEKLKNEEDLQISNEIVKANIDIEIANSKFAITRLENIRAMYRLGDDYRHVLCRALTVYLSDLQRDAALIVEKIAPTNLPLINVEYEIRLVEEAKKEICTAEKLHECFDATARGYKLGTSQEF